MNIEEMNRRLQKIKRKKEIKEEIIFTIIFILIIMVIGFLMLKAFTITDKDKQAYNTCMETYNDVKVCNKEIYGIYQ